MTYASAVELYGEILKQVDDGQPENAIEIALDALKSAYGDKPDDLIRSIVDIGLNFELSGRFGGDRVEVLLDVSTSNSLSDAISLLRKDDIRVEAQTNGDRIRSETTNQVPVTDRLVFFFKGSSCFLTMHKHPRHDLIVIQVVRRDYKKS